MSDMTPEQYQALFGEQPQPGDAAPPNRQPAFLPEVLPTSVPQQIQAVAAPPSPGQPVQPPVQVAIYNAQNDVGAAVPTHRTDVPAFYFNGGAGTYVGTAILGFLITAFTFGICYPFALVLRQRWQAKHTFIEGRRLIFTGSAWGLFGNWLKWLLLMVVTFGIYSFWVIPRIVKWKTENLAFDPTHPA